MTERQIHITWGIVVVLLLGVIFYLAFGYSSEKNYQAYEPNQNAVVNNETNNPIEVVSTTPTSNEIMPGPMPEMSYKLIKSVCEPNNQSSTISLLADGKEVTVLKSAMCEITKVIFRTGNSELVYFSVEPGGLGGYYIYSPAFNLYKLDLKNKTVSQLSNSIANLDFDANLTKAVIVTTGNAKVLVKDLATNTDETFGTVSIAEQGQIGNVKFSPDLTKVAIALGYGPDNEYGEIYVLDLATKKFSLYKKLSSGHLQVNGWKNNEEVDWSTIQ